jgi:hypothetical protein
MLCFVLAEALLERLGGDTLLEMRRRFDQLPRDRLDDLEMNDEPQTFWD